LIIDARNSIRPYLVLAGIICIGVTGLILDKTIRSLENWVEKQWGISSERMS
jgi:NitT/TauT family transport system permease protein